MREWHWFDGAPKIRDKLGWIFCRYVVSGPHPKQRLAIGPRDQAEKPLSVFMWLLSRWYFVIARERLLLHRLDFEVAYFYFFFEVLNLARNVTQEDDTQKAKDEFIKILNRSEMFYNKRDIPKNESSPAAHKLCSSIHGAKIFCPVRWNAMQNWFAHAREVSSKQILNG